MTLTLPIASTWDGHALPAAAHAVVQVAHGGPDTLLVRALAPQAGDPPPSSPPGPTEGLWEHEVVEWFCAGVGGAMLEVELGPHGHHCALRLSGPRRRHPDAPTPLPLAVQRAVAGRWWAAEAQVPRSWLPDGPHAVNAFRIHGAAYARQFHAHAPLPGPRADFHQPDRFVPVALPDEPTDPLNDLMAAVLALRPAFQASADPLGGPGMLLTRVTTLLRATSTSWPEAAAALAASLLLVP